MATVDYPEKIANVRTQAGDNPQTRHLVEYYARLGQWCDSAYDEAISLQQDVPELKEISTAIDYLAGLQWKESMPAYRAKPVSNEMLAMFWEAIGLLTDVKPMFTIEDQGGTGDYSRIESVLNQLAKGWAKHSRFERRLAFCTMFAMLTTAPAHIYWNPFANGFSGDPMDGDITLEALPPSALLRLGMGDTYQDDECLIYRKVRTLDWIKRAYKRMGPLVTPDMQRGKYTVDIQGPVSVTPQFYPPLSPGMRRMIGLSDTSTVESVYPTAEVREFWMRDDSVNESHNIVWMGPERAPWRYQVKPGQMLYPRGRCIVRANDVTLWDEPNPYYHRKKPFVSLALYDVPWQSYAMSVLSPWVRQQDILNQIMAGLLNCIKKAVNPPLLSPKSAIREEAMRAIDSSKPGLKISYNSNAGTAPTWGNPPNVPTYVLNAYGIIVKSMKQMSGAGAMDEATGKKQVPGGDTLDRITFAKNTPTRMMGRNIEYFCDDVGDQWVGNALQFYTAERRIQLLGKKGLVEEDMDDRPGSLIPEGIDSESFVRRWKYSTDKGTLLNAQRQDKVQISFALRKNHDLSRAELFRQLDWNLDTKRNEEELQAEAEAAAKAMAAAGIKPGDHKKK